MKDLAACLTKYLDHTGGDKAAASLTLAVVLAETGGKMLPNVALTFAEAVRRLEVSEQTVYAPEWLAAILPARDAPCISGSLIESRMVSRSTLVSESFITASVWHAEVALWSSCSTDSFNDGRPSSSPADRNLLYYRKLEAPRNEDNCVLSIKFLSSVAADTVPLGSYVAAPQVQLLQELMCRSGNGFQLPTTAFFTLRA